MSTRRRTYGLDSSNELEMSRYVFSIYDSMSTYSTGRMIIYDIKTGMSREFTPHKEDLYNKTANSISHYNGVIYISRVSPLGLGSDSYFPTAPSIGQNVVTYFESIITDSWDRRVLRTDIVTVEDGYIGYSYMTNVDHATGQLYSFCLTDIDGSESSHIMKLDSNYNITDIVKTSGSIFNSGASYKIIDGYLYYYSSYSIGKVDLSNGSNTILITDSSNKCNNGSDSLRYFI